MREQGVEALSDAELLALLLGGRGAEAEARASALLAEGAVALRRVKPGLLSTVPGLRRAQSQRIFAALELGRRVALAAAAERQRFLRASDLAALFAPRLAHLDHEEFWALLLSPRLERMHEVRISVGGITHCSILPREALAPAVLHAAPCVAFAHNHPSGDPTPSINDDRVQMLLDEAGRALGIHVVDHLVVASRGHHSRHEGFLAFDGNPIPEPPREPPGLEEHDFPIAFTEVRQ